MSEITVGAFLELKQLNKPYELFDIRELYELEVVNIGAKHFPMADVLENLERIPSNYPVIFFCKSGQRAGALVALLREMYGFKNVFSLQGGILEYINQAEPTLPTY